jgi:hypothetical protein
MKNDWIRPLFLLSAAVLLAAAPHRPELRWYRGNTHTHTLWSDGNAAPEVVADQYKRAGYQFLVLSDHNVVLQGETWKPVGAAKGQASPQAVQEAEAVLGKGVVELRERDGVTEMRLRTLDELRKLHEEAGRFLFIPGEEITDEVMKLPLHHNAVNVDVHVKPPGGKSMREAMERAVAAVEEEERRSGKPALIHLNHPNFHWAVTPEDIAAVFGERYFEVYNGHRGVRNQGDAQHLSTEDLWDDVLARRLGELGGPVLYGLATDDAHHYRGSAADRVAGVGRGWIMVRAAELSADALLRALKAGDFYATTGVLLEEVRVSPQGLSLRVAADGDASFSVEFIGTTKGERRGKVLARSEGREASYAFQGTELYVRARVTSSRTKVNGYLRDEKECAWTQPALPGR